MEEPPHNDETSSTHSAAAVRRDVGAVAGRLPEAAHDARPQRRRRPSRRRRRRLRPSGHRPRQPPPRPASPPVTPPRTALAPVTPPKPSEYAANDALRDIYFAFDKADIRPGEVKTLDANGTWLKGHDNGLLLIEGHCDERGTAEYNLALGERRAKTAMNYRSPAGSPRVESRSSRTARSARSAPSTPRRAGPGTVGPTSS